jgi:hypothetical protein
MYVISHRNHVFCAKKSERKNYGKHPLLKVGRVSGKKCNSWEWRIELWVMGASLLLTSPSLTATIKPR